MKLAGDERTLEFELVVMRQSFDVGRAGREAASDSDNAEQRYRGAVTAADVADPAAVERMIEATLDGKALAVAWTHSEDRRTHELTVPGITNAARGRADTVKARPI